MRILLPILLVLTVGCGDRNAGGEEGAAGADSEAAALAAAAEAAAPDPARLQALVERAMATLPGGARAKYRNVRAGSNGAACGEVALQSPLFRPFVVSPQAFAIVAAGPAIAFEDPADPAADAWIRWCATPEDLLALEPRLRAAEAAAPAVDGNLLAPPPLDLQLPEAAAPPPRDAPAPPRKDAPAPPQQIDSFFNSVQRPGQDS